MRKINLCLLLLFLLFEVAGQELDCTVGRYTEEIFTSDSFTEIQFGKAPYFIGDTINLFANVYEPGGDESTARPLIVLGFPGSLLGGMKDDVGWMAEIYAKKGFVVAAIDYRIWPLFILGIPTEKQIKDVAIKAMGDMKAAIRYFKEDASTENRFRIDTNSVFAAGLSAGSIVALNTGLLDIEDTMPQDIRELIEANGGIRGNSSDNFEHLDDVAGVINLAGAVFDTTIIDKNDPPIYSAHGTVDEVVPPRFGFIAGFFPLYGSILIHDQSLRKGIFSTLDTIVGAGHDDLLYDPIWEDARSYIFRRIDTFARKIICNDLVSGFNQKIFNQKFKMYPNPANQMVNLKFQTEIVEGSIQVFDLLGKLMSHHKIQDEKEVQISTSRLSSGNLYILQVFDHKTGAQGNKKLSIIR